VETQEAPKKPKAEKPAALAKYQRGKGPIKLKNLALSKEARDALSVHAIAYDSSESVLADYVIRTHLRAHKIARYSESTPVNEESPAKDSGESLPISETLPFEDEKALAAGEGGGAPPALKEKKRRA
jgi:hypothetical protein